MDICRCTGFRIGDNNEISSVCASCNRFLYYLRDKEQELISGMYSYATYFSEVPTELSNGKGECGYKL